MLLPGSWLRTGDVVTIDADGFVTVVDRIKELIITGEFNVYPSEVETGLRRIPASATPPPSACPPGTARRSSPRWCSTPPWARTRSPSGRPAERTSPATRCPGG